MYIHICVYIYVYTYKDMYRNMNLHVNRDNDFLRTAFPDKIIYWMRFKFPSAF